jgi:hypothetical protein
VKEGRNGRNSRRKTVKNRVAVDWMDLRCACEDLNITLWNVSESIPMREKGTNLEKGDSRARSNRI